MVKWWRDNPEPVALGAGVIIGGCGASFDSALLALVFVILCGVAFGAVAAYLDWRA